MDNNGEALYELVKEIKRAFNHMARNLPFDKTYIGIISSVNTDGYTIKYNGTEINIKTNATDVFKKGDMVKFCIPCGNKRKAYFVVDLWLVKRYMDDRIAEI